MKKMFKAMIARFKEWLIEKAYIHLDLLPVDSLVETARGYERSIAWAVRQIQQLEGLLMTARKEAAHRLEQAKMFSLYAKKLENLLEDFDEWIRPEVHAELQDDYAKLKSKHQKASKMIAELQRQLQNATQEIKELKGEVPAKGDQQ